MKITLLAMFVMALPTLYAQPTIDKYQLFRLGDSGEYLGLETRGLDPGPAGKDVVWDFSQVERDHYADHTLRYMEPKDSPLPNGYPGTDLVHFYEDAFTRRHYYLQSRGNRVFRLGFNGSVISTNEYTDVSFFPDLQLAFGQTNSSSIKGAMFTKEGVNTRRRTRIVGETEIFYDGFGKLLLPGGSVFDNVIRLKSTKTWEDAFASGSESGNLKFEEVLYQYFEQGHSAYLFQIRTYIVSRKFQGRFQRLSKTETAAYRVASTSNPQLTVKRATHLTQNGSPFQSEILIQNPTAKVQTVTLTGVDADGTAFPAAEVEMMPGTTVRQNAGEALGADAASFFSEGCNECVLSVDYRALSSAGAATQVHQNRDFRNEFTFYPGEWEQLSDGQAIINTSGSPSTLTATQFDFEGNILKEVTLAEDLAPGGKHLSLLNDLFIPEPDSTVHIKSDGLMSMMALRISNDARFLYQNLPLPAGVDASLGRWLTHFTRESSGFTTEVLVNNRSDEEAQLLFQPYNDAGEKLTPKWMKIDAGKARRFAKLDLFSAEASHASFDGATDCVVSLVYRANVADASSAVIHESPPLGDAFRMYPGDRSRLFDGLALINTGSLPATISLTQVADDGEVLGQVELASDLAPNAKFLSLLAGLVPENPEATLKIESSQPLAVLSLRLSKDNRYLFGNQALPE